MTTQHVTKVHCDRCKRVEERVIAPFDPLAAIGPGIVALETPPIKSWAGTAPMLAFTATILDDAAGGTAMPREVKFQDLCGPCKRTVAALLDQIGKKIDGLSPERKERGAKKKEGASTKTPSQQHHSAAAGSASGNGLRTGIRSS